MTSSDHEQVSQLIAAKLSSGVLPSTLPTSVVRSAGVGHRCVACEMSIGSSQLETECTFSDGRWLRLHLDCFQEWRRQRGP